MNSIGADLVADSWTCRIYSAGTVIVQLKKVCHVCWLFMSCGHLVVLILSEHKVALLSILFPYFLLAQNIFILNCLALNR